MFAVWVDNEKKEKEVATGKSNNAEEDLGYWNLAENRISDIDVADELHSDKNKLTEPKYVGTENTPSVAVKKQFVRHMDPNELPMLKTETSDNSSNPPSSRRSIKSHKNYIDHV